MSEDIRTIAWTLDAKIENSTLKVHVRFKQSNSSGYEYCYIVLCDGIVVHRKNTNSPYIEYELTDDGSYVAQCRLKKKGQASLPARSMPKHYASDVTRHGYNEFVTSIPRNFGLNGSRDCLKFGSQLAPFQDILVISNRNVSGKALAAHEGLSPGQALYDRDLSRLEIHEGQGWRTQIHGRSICKVHETSAESNRRLMFSGITIYNGDIITSETESLSQSAATAMQGAYGSFSCVDISTDRIRLHTDFFAFNRFFYYKTEDVLFASNRYHLLLLSLKNAGIELRLDRAKVIANFWSVSHQISLQNFTRKMDVTGVVQLPNEFDLVLESGEWTFSQNEFGSILDSRQDLSEAEISASLDEIANELVAGLAEVVGVKDFDNVIMDLSGGLDSRCVFATATNVPKAREKVKIRSFEVSGEALEIPIGLNSVYNFDHDTVKETVRYLDPEEMDQLHRSFYLGTYFAHGLQLSSHLPDSSIRLNGACGEILARPYIVRNFLFGTRCELQTTTPDFVEEMIRVLSPHSLGGEEAFSAFRDFLLDEVEQYGSCSDFEAIDRMYLVYRHGFHFDGGIVYGTQGLSWMPLQNKRLFKLHHNCFDRLRGLEIQIPLLYRLNPLIATLPYQRVSDNLELERLRNVLATYDCRFSNISVLTSRDRSIFDCAVEDKELRREFSNKPHPNAGDLHTRQYAAAFNLLHEIMNAEHLDLPEEVGLSIWQFLQKNKSDTRRIRTLYNKLASAVDQYRLVSSSRADAAWAQ